MRTENRITLKTLAEHFGVTEVTISKALRDHPDISLATTAKIKSKAKELGYIPNYFAKHLSARKTKLIGVVIPKIAHYFFSTIVQSIQECALKEKYEIVLMVSHENAEIQEKNLKLLLSMKVDGIIISVTQDSISSGAIDQLVNSQIPIVFVDRVLDYPQISKVTVNDFVGTRELIEFVIARGYNKIAHIGGPQTSSIGEDRYKGYVTALEKAGIEVNNNWVKFLGFSEAAGEKGFAELMQEEDKPDIIFAVTYPVAIGVINAAKRNSLRVPEDVGVVCFGGSDFNELLANPITCMKQPAAAMGREAINVLITQINAQEEIIQKHIKLSTELYVGKTCSEKTNEYE